jgi:hypothetical protein
LGFGGLRRQTLAGRHLIDKTPKRRGVLGLLALVLAALTLGSEAPAAPPSSPPLVGFSYSPELSQWLYRDPSSDLWQLLDATNPDLVRLPVYWEETEPSPGTLDFDVIDQLLSVVALHNLTSSRQTRVILNISARNFLYPELHAPLWAGPRQQPELGDVQAGAAYRLYFDATLARYRSSPLVYAWQVENEPFDYVVNQTTGDDQISLEQMQWEIAEVHMLDPDHAEVTTSFDAWSPLVDWLQLNAPALLAQLHGYPSGHPGPILAVGDVLGLDAYVDSPSTPLRFTSIALRTSWKAEDIGFWAGIARAQNKQVWLTEMQAAPWSASPGAFSTADLVAGAATYRRESPSVVLLWGADTWLQDPSWMKAAVSAMGILRAP